MGCVLSCSFSMALHLDNLWRHRHCFVFQGVRLKLSEDQFTCCALHIELDSGPEGHGLKQRRVAAEHLKEGQWVPFVEGALEGGRMWGEMMIVALRTPLYASLAFSSKKSS